MRAPAEIGLGIEVDVRENLSALLRDEDTDDDTRITVQDPQLPEQGRGDRRFRLTSTDGRHYEVVGTDHLSNLLQELVLARDAGLAVARIDFRRIYENPVRRCSRLTREIRWDGLTRRIDEQGIDRVLFDEKTATDGYRYLYVPRKDRISSEYYSDLARRRPDLKLRVERLPAKITPEFVRDLGGKHGLLALALRRKPGGGYAGVPFVVPGGRFNEMYGWDSYFIVLGLQADGRVGLAKAMVDNLAYQITHYGKILNANRTYYLNRSQPPLLTTMALAVYRRLPRGDASRAWLRGVLLAAINEYYNVWTDEKRLTRIGLSRYHGSGLGVPPEVEPGHFDPIYRPHAARRGMGVREFEAAYKAGTIHVPELDAFWVHDAALRESGHDCTYRWNVAGLDRCADFATVDLNSLLYKVELDLARTIAEEFGGALTRADGGREESATWSARARRRKALIDEYLWDERRGMYFDYHIANGRRSDYVSATALYPLWACHADAPETRLMTPERADRLVATALPLLEMPGGLAASAEGSRGPLSESRPARQWDYPTGWPPHQMLAWRGLLNYGLDATAHRLICRWLYTITRTAADYNGAIVEKYDVVNRSHKVHAEYGNVGANFEYLSREGFGWTNASLQVGLQLLPSRLRHWLEQLVAPEFLFESRSSSRLA